VNHILLVLCLVCFPCAALSQNQTNASSGAAIPGQASLAANTPDDFVIGPEDVLEIKVWKEPDLTTKGVVRPDGKLGVTLLGDVQASGLTTVQLKDAITTRLERFVQGPIVSVVVVEIHSQMVHLIGAVNRPGAYTLGGPLTVVELLARAGGLTELTSGEGISIVRTIGSESRRILFNYREFSQGKNLRQNIPLKNGDVVVVR